MCIREFTNYNLIVRRDRTTKIMIKNSVSFPPPLKKKN